MKMKKMLSAAIFSATITGMMAGSCFASPTRAQVDAEDAPYIARGIAMEYYTDDDFANDRVPENVEDRMIEPDSGCTSGED